MGEKKRAEVEPFRISTQLSTPYTEDTNKWKKRSKGKFIL